MKRHLPVGNITLRASLLWPLLGTFKIHKVSIPGHHTGADGAETSTVLPRLVMDLRLMLKFCSVAYSYVCLQMVRQWTEVPSSFTVMDTVVL